MTPVLRNLLASSPSQMCTATSSKLSPAMTAYAAWQPSHSQRDETEGNYMAAAETSRMLRVRSNKRLASSVPVLTFPLPPNPSPLWFSSRTPVAARVENKAIMTTLTKTVRRVTVEKYGYGRNARKLVAAFEKGDLITIREHRRRAKFSARVCDVYWWMLRCQADKIRMEKLRKRKARKAARLADRRQHTAEKRLFNG